ncbi:4Fe-4S_ferredoxin [Hexamita inflata]|uniref:4Fe-4S ferredoxin n=1 Tax=Hexamita inflata TaxID=28002 RepID=A0AA86ULK7_9EUKA|nr:4Fe-4S ferredoxin [Hexamita inflata]CAI9958705.1 4Fe-4S ferredoxin [Hexamita inflata]CAI9963070.1 4Fe-4S ferredoxin [Hexamita inflata]CAI9969048.1 4Fe-4S ferredoxin [Hexamita inflata]
MPKQVQIDVDTCIGCGACINACPNEALELVDGKSKMTGPCLGSGECVDVCPVQALSLK